MSLLSDPAFLVYQLRVSFLRSSDPAGERVLTFDDLSVPLGTVSERAQNTPITPMTPQSRRKTSASEIRRQVAHNTAANAYIMACGHYPETDGVHSPEIEHDEGYMYSRPTNTQRPMHTKSADTPSARFPAGAPTRNKRTNRNAKIAPTGEGREEVVGLGVVPPHAEMMQAYHPLPVVEEADAGSLSDSAQPEPPARHWQPEPMPPRRSLDTIHHGRQHAQPRGERRHVGHAYSSSMATIRLQQRPSELLRKGSSRDAIALGIDFDVKSMFEGDDALSRPAKKASARSSAEGQNEDEDARPEHALPKLGISKQKPEHKPRKKSTASIEIRARRNETSFKIPLASL
ncbi:hypothetical protein IWW50_000928, partial [Coemansia erecta]